MQAFWDCSAVHLWIPPITVLPFEFHLTEHWGYEPFLFFPSNTSAFGTPELGDYGILLFHQKCCCLCVSILKSHWYWGWLDVVPFWDRSTYKVMHFTCFAKIIYLIYLVLLVILLLIFNIGETECVSMLIERGNSKIWFWNYSPEENKLIQSF